MTKHHQKGVAMLPLVLALSFIILIVVLSLASLGFVETSIGSAQKKADEAFFVANAGVSDAIMRITRNKNYSIASPGYNITVSNGTANVIVQKDVPSAGKSRITATGTVGFSKRKIQVDVTVSTYGKVTTDSFTELAP